MKNSLLLLVLSSAFLTVSCSESGDPGNGQANPQVAACGNLTIDQGEQCDDGNISSGDGCSAVCQIEGVAGTSPSPLMSFFVTSVGSGVNGGNLAAFDTDPTPLNGLAGGDIFCTDLANTAYTNGGASIPAGKQWRAYLSTSGIATGGPVVDARDRIGGGPWRNYFGDLIVNTPLTTSDYVEELHSVAHPLTTNRRNDNAPGTIAAGIPFQLAFTETGNLIDPTSDHDILTGSTVDGLNSQYPNCFDWTSNAPKDLMTDEPTAQVGHIDWDSTVTVSSGPWNDNHSTAGFNGTGGCDEASLIDHLGIGRLYCFDASIQP